MNASANRRTRRSLWVLFALSLLSRAAFVAYHAHLGWQLRFDPGYYLTLAENLRHGAFSMFHPLDIPDTTRMPGYPFLLFLLKGEVPIVLMLQVLVSALKVPLVFALARMVGLPERPAVWAAALMAFAPMDILLAGNVLTEAVFTTLLLGGVVLALRDERWPSIAGAVMCFAAAAWMRPNGLVLALLLALLLVLVLRRSRSRSLAIIAGTLLLLSPWILRYHGLSGKVGLSDSGTMTAAYFHVPRVLITAHDPRAKGYRQELYERASATDWTDHEAVAHFFAGLRTEITGTLRAHPLAWSQVHGGTMLRTLAAPGRGHLRMFFRDVPLVHRALLVLSGLLVLVVLMGLAGLAIAWREVPRGIWLLVLLSFAVLFTGGISLADARFRDPAMPFLLVIAAWSLNRVLVRVRRPTPH